MNAYGEPNIDPAREWDLYCDRQEQAYRAYIEGKTCEDCGHCVKPDESWWENPERMGYCTVACDFVSLDDSVEDEGCEDFE
jgi:hypothetical protein